MHRDVGGDPAARPQRAAVAADCGAAQKNPADLRARYPDAAFLFEAEGVAVKPAFVFFGNGVAVTRMQTLDPCRGVALQVFGCEVPTPDGRAYIGDGGRVGFHGPDHVGAGFGVREEGGAGAVQLFRGHAAFVAFPRLADRPRDRVDQALQALFQHIVSSACLHAGDGGLLIQFVGKHDHRDLWLRRAGVFDGGGGVQPWNGNLADDNVETAPVEQASEGFAVGGARGVDLHAGCDQAVNRQPGFARVAVQKKNARTLRHCRQGDGYPHGFHGESGQRDGRGFQPSEQDANAR